MTKKKDSFEIMAIIIIFDTLHDNYNIITVSILEIGNKSINKIFAIIQLEEAKFKNKYATKNIDNVAITI